jgi:peroxidase
MSECYYYLLCHPHPCCPVSPAGDERVNEQNQLTALHTLWAREHNRIEAQLHRLNPQWGATQLFEEARRIVAALHQRITYGEWLPAVLGSRAMSRYGLELVKDGEYYTGEGNPQVHCTLFSVRLGHTDAHIFSHDKPYTFNMWQKQVWYDK